MIIILFATMQTGMGYGMYTLVLPFFAWMIVLVVSFRSYLLSHQLSAQLLELNVCLLVGSDKYASG